MEMMTRAEVPFEENPAAIYAAVRNELYAKGFKIEIFAGYEPRLRYFAEWWKQLFGESEGKGGRGIFPASANFTSDLHSLGQYIQDGERTIFETVLSVAKPAHTVVVNSDPTNPDGLDHLAGCRVGEINRIAEKGVSMAHAEGGVPNIRIEIPELTPYYTGALIYLLEKACAISGYILGVNPFDQPGVEAYKRNVVALLEGN
jgi:glucose-6-phosphate isomerase